MSELILMGLFGFVAMVAALIASSAAARAAVARMSGGSELPWFGPNRDSWKPAVLAGLAGSLAPLVIVWIVALLGHLVDGESVTTTQVDVHPGPAETAGMKYGDRITAIDGVAVNTWEAVKGALKEPRKAHRIALERDAHPLEVLVTSDENGRIGIVSVPETRSLSLIEAAQTALLLPFRVLASTVDAFRSPTTELAGPVAIVRETGRAGSRRTGSALRFLALLAAYFWPTFIIAHALEVATFPLFARTHPDAREADRGRRALWRIARLRQALHIVLVLSLPASVWWALSDWPGGGASVPVLAWLGPVLYPLAWVLAAAIRSRWAAAVYVLVLMVPILNFAALWHLSRSARQHLAANGIVAGWLGARQDRGIAT